MASSTVGTAVIKLSFDGSDVKAELSKTSNQVKSAGTDAGASFANAMTVAMGSLISKGVSKVISSVTSNIDSAINRSDVMGNFPKVMKSLGFSTEEAASSVQLISSRLDGLPSTLNGVISDVQKLTATMNNLNQGEINATTVGLALNDMFLAGGKGAEAASNAMEQYNQMLAQGKPDLQSWRSILNAAPGQLKQLANSLLGATANQQDLYDALKEGNISFEQLNEAIVRLDREGGDGFESFEKQARAATGGIGTALDNVQNRISKAIVKVIDAIGSENIANVINEFSSHFGEIGTQVGEFVKFSMVKIGEFVKFLQENTWIVETIKGVIASIVSIGLGYKIMELQKKVVSLFAALAAHPILAIISAVVGLTVALSGITSQETELTRAMKATKEECDKATQSWSEMAKRRQESLDKGMSELAYYENLQKELAKITDENGKVKEGYEERAKFITTKLSNALGVEIELIDGVVQGNKEVQSEISKTIEVKKAELKLKAQEEAYTEAIKGRLEASKRMAKIEQEIRDAMNEGTIESAKRALELSQAYDEQETLVGEYSATIKGYEADLASFTAGEYNKMSAAAWNWVDDLVKAEQVDEQTLQKAIRETETSLRTNKRLYEKYGDDVYKTEMEKDNERLSLLKTKMGAYNSITSSGLNTSKTTWNNSLSAISNSVWNQSGNAVNAVKNTMDSMVSVLGGSYGAFYSVGANSIYGMSNGWTDRAYEVASKMVNSVMDQVKWMMGIHSPSTVFRDQVGAMLARGLGIGFVNEMGSVSDDMVGAIPMSFGMPAYATAWSSGIEGAIMEQSGSVVSTSNNINVYMNNTIDNDMSIDEVGRKFSQSIRRYA